MTMRFAAILLLATTASAPVLRHYDIRPAALPPPYATPSAGHPALVLGRPSDARLYAPPGFHISLYAEGLDNPRNMVLAPNGDVFIACAADSKIVVLRDANGDGRAEKRWTYIDGLDDPFGLAFRGNQLFVGESGAVVRFDYRPGDTRARGKSVRVVSLPRGGHSTRNVVFNRDGSKMYVAVGSASNVSDESSEPLRAAITEFNPDGSGRRTFASGMRNPIGLAWNPANQTLWTAVNERDGLGDELVPDYISEVRRGAFYGWPFAYIGNHPDPRHRGARYGAVTVPSLLIASHSAPITLAFYDGTMFPARYRGGAFVALHGSWNRSRLTGYKVVHVPFRNGQPSGGYDDFVIGWAPDPGAHSVWGRPAGLLVLRDGSLLISDDAEGSIWRVTYDGGKPARYR